MERDEIQFLAGEFSPRKQPERWANMASVLKKITMKTIGFGMPTLKALLFKSVDGKVVPVEDGTDFYLAKVVGVVTAIRPGQGDNGPFVKLIGEFEAINNETGEVHSSPVCLLPQYLSDMIAGRVASSQGGVEFGVEIGIKASAASSTGYEFIGRSLIAMKPSDRMQALKQAALGGPSNVTSLPAPVPTVAAPQPEPTPTKGRKTAQGY